MMILEFAAKKRKRKTKTCEKGYPCGNSCITRKNKCKRKFNDQASTYSGWLKKQANKTVDNSKNTRKKLKSITDKAVEKHSNKTVENSKNTRKKLKSITGKAVEKHSKKPQSLKQLSKEIQEDKKKLRYSNKLGTVKDAQVLHIKDITSEKDGKQFYQVTYLDRSAKSAFADKNDYFDSKNELDKSIPGGKDYLNKVELLDSRLRTAAIESQERERDKFRKAVSVSGSVFKDEPEKRKLLENQLLDLRASGRDAFTIPGGSSLSDGKNILEINKDGTGSVHSLITRNDEQVYRKDFRKRVSASDVDNYIEGTASKSVQDITSSNFDVTKLGQRLADSRLKTEKIQREVRAKAKKAQSKSAQRNIKINKSDSPKTVRVKSYEKHLRDRAKQVKTRKGEAEIKTTQGDIKVDATFVGKKGELFVHGNKEDGYKLSHTQSGMQISRVSTLNDAKKIYGGISRGEGDYSKPFDKWSDSMKTRIKESIEFVTDRNVKVPDDFDNN